MSNLSIGCAALAVVALIGGCVAAQMHREQHVFTVSSKERQCDASGSGSNRTISCYYVVFGTGGEVFSNRDDPFNGKWDSASIQARFIPGRTYRVTTTGWRNPFLSMKPNIIAMQDASQPSKVPLQ